MADEKIPTVLENKQEFKQIATSKENYAHDTPGSLLVWVLTAFFVGWIKYLYEIKVIKQGKISWLDSLIYAAVSGISGYVTVSIALAIYPELGIKWMGGIVGISGWMGVRNIQIFEDMLANGLMDRFKGALFTFFDYSNKDKDDK